MASEQDAAYFTVEWTRENISSRGPLGAFYRVWGDGKQMVKGDIFDYFGIAGKTAQELAQEGYIVWTPPQAKGAFLGEGDTVTYLNLIDNGLLGYRGDSFGGWGGYAHEAPPRPMGDFLAQVEAYARNPGSAPARQIPRAPTHPFLAPAQRDLAARFAWATIATYSGANHHPRLSIRGSRFITAKAGQVVKLSVTASDPDGNAVAIRWWHWSEADTYDGAISLSALQDVRTQFTVPQDMKPGQTIQVIAAATDNGEPALTRYAKFVITMSP